MQPVFMIPGALALFTAVIVLCSPEVFPGRSRLVWGVLPLLFGIKILMLGAGYEATWPLNLVIVVGLMIIAVMAI